MTGPSTPLHWSIASPLCPTPGTPVRSMGERWEWVPWGCPREPVRGSPCLLILLPRPPIGIFNPNSEDPLPGQLKKQLVLRIISGQQLPKPRDSMLGDRGEVGRRAWVGGRAWLLAWPAVLPCPVYQIIDPFVEVEVIGLPVDCNKEQTRVVDDNGEHVGGWGCRRGVGTQRPACAPRPHHSSCAGDVGLTR